MFYKYLLLLLQKESDLMMLPLLCQFPSLHLRRTLYLPWTRPCENDYEANKFSQDRKEDRGGSDWVIKNLNTTLYALLHNLLCLFTCVSVCVKIITNFSVNRCRFLQLQQLPTMAMVTDAPSVTTNTSSLPTMTGEVADTPGASLGEF